MARLAPKAAAEEEPKVKGEARSFASTVCIRKPLKAKAAPETTLIRTDGNLIFFKMCKNISFFSPLKLRSSSFVGT